MLVLGIESSCDETGVALYDTEAGLLSHTLYSQVELHAAYGGVVPELASRDHIQRVIPLIQRTLKTAGKTLQDLEGIAYTRGPGLLGALLVGSGVARSLAFALDIPAIGVHHMEGHLLAPMLEADPPAFPFVALLVSGGHTLLVEVRGLGQYRLLGETLDDAAGEAFDKTAKLLGLGYPGGPKVSALAKQGRPGRFTFPRPMVDRPGLQMSFSGLKTAVLNAWRTAQQTGETDEQTKADICLAFETAVAETLAIKCKRALKETGLNQLVVSGGVSANETIRKKLQDVAKKTGGQAFFPRLAFCTDNGAMIAYAGAQRLAAGQHQDLDFSARARWPLEELTAPPQDPE